MNEEKSTNKILTIILAIVLIVAVIVVVYANLPETQTNENNNDNSNQDQNGDEEKELFTVIYGDEEKKYTMDNLINQFVPRTGFGAKRTNKPSISSPGNYTGILITDFIEEFSEELTNYSINVTSNEEGEVDFQIYNYTTIQGTVKAYNISNATDNLGYKNMKMILSYKKDGEHLDPSDDGNFMIGFINENKKYSTPAFFWWKFVESIEIIID